MDCSIADVSGFRILARAVQCSAKIGDDVTFSASSAGLHVRTVNASHSACADFHFRPSFFSRFAEPRTEVTARVPARALLPIFRAPGAVSAARLSHDPRDGRLVLRLASRAGARKTFRIPISDALSPAPVYDREKCPSLLRVRPRFLLDLLANFHARLDEITIAATLGTLRVSSFVDEAARGDASSAMLRTSVAVDAREFDAFRVATPDTALTFYCRPFRSVLEFCDALESTLSVHFAAAGQPLIFAVDLGSPGATPHFDATFVFATRLVTDDGTPTPGGTAARTESDPSSRRSSELLESGPRQSTPRPKLTLAETPAEPEESERTRSTRSTPPKRRLSGHGGYALGSSSVPETPGPSMEPEPHPSLQRNTPDRPNLDERAAAAEDHEMPQADVNPEEDGDENDEFVDGTPPPSQQ